MTDNAALLMRAIVDELAQRLIPELRSADAVERGNFARLVLQDLASDIDVLPGVADEVVPEFRRIIDEALRRLATLDCADVSAEWRTELDGIASDRGMARQREVSGLRALASRIVRHLADRAPDIASGAHQDIERTIATLGGIDVRWLTAYDAARTASAEARRPSTAAASDSPPASSGDAVTVDNVTAYLRRVLAGSPRVEATAVTPIPGGRSKKTYFISVGNTDALPNQFVMRQDYALRYEGTKVRDEYRPLLRLAQAGLPVPRPLHLEADVSELGPPFIFVERLSGSAPGSYFRLQHRCAGAFRDLAVMLAKLHATDAADLGFPPGRSSM